ncbi:hypothetical protein I350_04697 [Cryptococcus amylolentus CBS 6273]|uniref:Major facilitator superfamily (MFS) profile domain-containing protein n=1 Tax=Cryptococcus amylolentus CBS 6273 TaxID=1296118 RepID=A0A1E3JXQ0_9TREE|nr:hypothetical protein I350_04697 [Cryptococcus amylolentus CBS 6273]
MTAFQDSPPGRALPWCHQWRSSAWFITLVVTYGIAIDTLTDAIVVPILPFRLLDLGYHNIASDTGQLLFARSAGTVTFTLPVAYFFHKYPYRRLPLEVSVLVMIAANVLLMLSTQFWTMILARYISGAASTVTLTVGLTLIGENVKEVKAGRHLGLAMSGLALGQSIVAQAPIGTVLYEHLGWKAPFIFCIGALCLDIFLRLFVLERVNIRVFHEKRLGLKPDSLKPKLLNGKITTPVHHHIRDFSYAELNKAEREALLGIDLNPWQVLKAMVRSPRGMTAIMSMFTYGLLSGTLQPVITVRIQELWNKNSDSVGLVYFIATFPTLISGPIVGYCADRWGAEWVMLPSMLLVLPWPPLMLETGGIGAFIVYFLFFNLFSNCAFYPSGLESTIIARRTQGISEIHQFGIMEVAFATATAVGTLVGGHVYDEVPSNAGWDAVMWFLFAIALLSLPMVFFFSGEDPWVKKIFSRKQPKIAGQSVSMQRLGDDNEDNAGGEKKRMDDKAEEVWLEMKAKMEDDQRGYSKQKKKSDSSNSAFEV